MEVKVTEYIPQSIGLIGRVTDKDIIHFSEGRLALNIHTLEGRFCRLELGTSSNGEGFVLNPPLHTAYVDIPPFMNRNQIALAELEHLGQKGYDRFVSILIDKDNKNPFHQSEYSSRFRVKKDEEGKPTEELELYVPEENHS